MLPHNASNYIFSKQKEKKVRKKNKKHTGLNWFYRALLSSFLNDCVFDDSLFVRVCACMCVSERVLSLNTFSFQSHFSVVKVLELLLSVLFIKREDQKLASGRLKVKGTEMKKKTTIENERSCALRLAVHPILSIWVSLFHFFHIVHMKHEYVHFFYLQCYPFIHLFCLSLSVYLSLHCFVLFFIVSNWVRVWNMNGSAFLKRIY